ncbi:MAG TPA: T9SS type A sorting domain-containing protein [Flavisolibacter sp.]|jgi:hypothetical protein|nr:T9SS type A sorting domain-containing protein [Flavisolibacter sp.]
MKKIFTRTGILMALLCFFIVSNVQAQAPTINAQVGFPVGQVQGKQVVYGNGRYILLGASNALFTAANGTSWSRISASGLSSQSLNNIAFGAGVFVVVGNNGVIQTSTDGITWTSRSSGTTSQLRRVSFVNNTFFATGANRTLLRSADGNTWTPVSINTGSATDQLSTMAYGNGVYLIAATTSGSSGSRIYRSTTAADNSWTFHNDAPVWGTMNRIQFLNDKFFCFQSGHEMFHSADGLTWTKFSTAVLIHQPDGSTRNWGSGHQIFNGVWDGTRYHFYGSSQYMGGYGSAFTTADLVNFTLLQKTAYIVPSESSYINGMYFIAGNEGVVSSADGLVYQHPGTSLNALTRTATTYIGAGAISQEGQIYTSTDFVNWTNRTPAGIKDLYGVAYDGSRVIAAGARYVLHSTDEGVSWTTAYTNTDETFYTMAYGNGKLLAAGYNNNTGAFLRYSTNGGASWTTASTNDYNYVKIKYVNNRWFAFATDNADYLGRIMTSTDGITWSDVTPDLGMEVLYYKDVAWDGSRYHVMGVESSNYTPVQFFTVSTATPGNSSSYGNKAVISNVPAGKVLGGSYDEGVLEYVNGTLVGAVVDVATGQDYIIYSADGSSWTALAQNSAGTITAAYADGNTVRMVAKGNAFLSASVGTVMPVTFLRFEGALERDGVKLDWSTGSEENSLQFLVQHSADGQGWKTIGSVAAAGSSTSVRNYSFLHTAPATGRNYYRLVQQDRDHKSTITRVVAVQVGGFKISGYPNPVSGVFHIRSTSHEPGLVVLYTISGQPVKRAVLQGYETAIDMQGLTAGVYYAEISQGGQVKKLRVVKQ